MESLLLIQMIQGISAEEWTELLCLYGGHIVLLAMLSAIAIFRREMSCNHCYAEEAEGEKEGTAGENGTSSENNNRICSSTSSKSIMMKMNSMNEEETAEVEELLEQAGLYCSGAALAPLLESFLELVHAEYNRPRIAWYESDKNYTDTKKGNVKSLDSLFGQDIVSALKNGHFLKRSSTSMSDTEEKDDFETSDTSFNHSSSNSCLLDSNSFCPFLNVLPSDAHVHVLSFLHPKDIVSFSGVSQSCLLLVNGGCDRALDPNRSDDVHSETSRALWKLLWFRDYAWTVQSWDVGREAFDRSAKSLSLSSSSCMTTPALSKNESEQAHDLLEKMEISFNRDFYFRFGLTFTNYMLAGQNTYERCLVGLHGHIYDLSLFLSSHPGSPETVLVQAGRDATAFFESVGHSRGARRLAQSLCVLVDRSRVSSIAGTAEKSNNHRSTNKNSGSSSQYSTCGFAPTSHTMLCADKSKRDSLTNTTKKSSLLSPIPSTAGPPLVESKSNYTSNGMSLCCGTGGTLDSVRKLFLQDYNDMRQIVNQKSFVAASAFGECNLYYDPFCRAWKAWYNEDNAYFEAVFLEDLPQKSRSASFAIQ